MAAFISYPSDMSDYTFSVYVNRSGLSFGYFFRGGGSLPNITESIAEISVSACNDRAYISMNVQNVQRVEIDDGRNKQVMEIDSNKPFAIVLPSNKGIVSFYDDINIPYSFGTFKIPFVVFFIKISFITCFGTLFNDVILERE